MSRRANGEGSIGQLLDGRWRAQVSQPDGTRKQLYGHTRLEVADKLRQVKRDQDDGRLVTSGRASVEEWLDQWLADHILPSVAPRTHETYETAVRVRLVPLLGHVQLSKLSGVHIQRAYATLSHTYAPKTVNHTHNVLHQALEAARKLRLIGSNPTADVTTPRRPDGHAGDRALTAEQVRVLDRAMVGHDFEPVWRFLLGTGVRWGEAAALTWDDVDIDSARSQVRIQRAATRIKGKMFVSTPKTRAGRRTIPLTMDAIAALRQQQNAVRKLKLAAQPGTWSDQDGKLVFPNPTGGLLRSNRPLAAFKRVLAEAGLPPKRLHDLRHTYATLLFARDVHPKVAQDLLGHTRIDMTLRIYTGSVPEVARNAVARLDDVFDRASGI